MSKSLETTIDFLRLHWDELIEYVKYYETIPCDCCQNERQRAEAEAQVYATSIIKTLKNYNKGEK